MKDIYLISCTSRKQNYKCESEEMYSKSTLFRASLEYSLNRVENKDSQIFILSAKHGLLALSEEIEPYDETLNKMKAAQRKEWGSNVYKQMKNKFDIENTELIFLAGKKYIEPIEQYIKKYTNPIPKEERMIGKRIKWLRENKEKENEKSLSQESKK